MTIAVIGMLTTAPAGATEQPCDAADSSCRRMPLLEAARSLPTVAPSPVTRSEEIAGPRGDVLPGEPRGRLMELLARHRYHFLAVFAVQEVDYLYEKRFGVSEEPRFFDGPTSFDRSLNDRIGEGSDNNSFLVRNKTNVMRAVALGAMAATNGGNWDEYADDLIGLLEAQKFNWASTHLVKTFVGRRRPSADSDLEAGIDPGERPSIRKSFYSDAASSAFTFMAYTDSVLARRLRGRPWARAASAVGLYGLAGYIAWSRVEQGRHYLTDVLAGAGAGFAVGKIFYRVNHRDEADHGRAEVDVRPALVPGGAGVFVSVEF